jgi:hypothetical protein
MNKAQFLEVGLQDQPCIMRLYYQELSISKIANIFLGVWCNDHDGSSWFSKLYTKVFIASETQALSTCHGGLEEAPPGEDDGHTEPASEVATNEFETIRLVMKGHGS